MLGVKSTQEMCDGWYFLCFYLCTESRMTMARCPSFIFYCFNDSLGSWHFAMKCFRLVHWSFGLSKMH